MWRRPGYLCSHCSQFSVSLPIFSKPGICLVEERAGYEGRDLGASLIDCVFEASQWKVRIVSVGGFLDKPPSIVRHEDNHRVLVLTCLHQTLPNLNKKAQIVFF